jgi:hypothetical protein
MKLQLERRIDKLENTLPLVPVILSLKEVAMRITNLFGSVLRGVASPEEIESAKEIAEILQEPMNNHGKPESTELDHAISEVMRA